MNHDTIINLQAALTFSPANNGLRMVLARTLMEEKLFLEAEEEYKHIIKNSPSNLYAKVGLARSAAAQGKHSMAFVILEEICSEIETPADCHVLFARELLSDGQPAEAAEQYRVAIGKDHRIQTEELDYLFG
jgi:transitional endoplasmic reticulum ATPase